MTETPDRTESVFVAAVALADADERAAYLEQACAGDADLRGRVEALLRAHARAGHLLDRPVPGGLELTGAYASSALPGTVIAGRYKLLQGIGEGGMGSVWVAEQTQPVRRKVALKLIKAGMDSKAVLARFEAERQALAVMDHPNIAKVLDGGATDTGRPFFVMEYVKGMPITEYCEAARLSVPERLQLFVQVCSAVQHAHQKGIIHRDLKPSNILVAPYDDRPVPKVIDFGLAKALHQSLTERTLHTAHETVLGTPLYMSPGQAQLNNLDVDTRSDIYSLGVLLYELLTGTTPLEKKRFKDAAWEEIRRLIREEEPPKPSTRLSSADTLPSLAASRQMEPARLTKLVRGELDWIVMKALEKDRARRYETANGFARDVERYLAGEPVLAAPPSARYRVGKFLRRHRGPLMAAATVLLALTLGGGGWLWVKAERDARRAQATRDVDDALRQVASLRAQTRTDPAGSAALFAQAREQVSLAVALIETVTVEEGLKAQVRTLKQELDEEEHDRKLLAALDAARLAQAETVVSRSDFNRGKAIPLFRDAFAAYGLPPGQGEPAATAERIRRRPAHVQEALVAALDQWLALAADPTLALAEPHRHWLTAVLTAAEPADGWTRQYRAACGEPDAAKRRAVLEQMAAAPDVRKLPARSLTRLAGQLRAVGAQERVVQLLRRTQQQYPADFWANHYLGHHVQLLTPPQREEAVRYLSIALALRPDSPGTHLNLGNALYASGRLEEAEACYRKALELAPEYAHAHNNLGLVLKDQSQLDAAIACYRKAIELDPGNAFAHTNLGVALKAQGQLDEALAACRQAIALNRKDARVYLNLSAVLAAKGQLDEASASARQAIVIDPNLTEAHRNLGQLLLKNDQSDEAIACFRRAVELQPKVAEVHTALGEALRDAGRLDEAIASLRKALELAPNDASGHDRLGVALGMKGRLDDAIDCFRKALAIDPRNAPALTNLGMALASKGQADEALTCYRKAIELDPKYATAHNNLGVALRDRGRLNEAIDCYRRAVELDPKAARAQQNLGNALAQNGQVAEAILCFRKALQANRKYLRAYFHLGEALKRTGQLDEAIACFRQAVEAGPNDFDLQNSLGALLSDYKRDYDGAIACFRRAIALNPKNVIPHKNLGVALAGKGRHDEAIATWRRAVELAPRDVQAHHLLGNALFQTARLAEASASFRQVVQLAPKWAPGHYSLGLALQAQGRLDEAGASYRKVIELDPRDAQAHCNLGHLLRAQGQFAAALPCFRRGHELGSATPGWPYPSARWVKECERFIELDPKLPDILSGKQQPAGAGERIEYAQLCQAKQWYAAGARLYGEVLSGRPAVAAAADDHDPYDAACAAALAAAGHGQDASKLDAPARQRLRRQARDWLNALLVLNRRAMQSETSAARGEVSCRLRHWQRDTDLAGVRDAAALANLPADERAAWNQLWADVAALLKQAEAEAAP
jgi:tetratricopeptide (TPR) repeat protein